jgi:hypothetical protein
VCSLFYACTHIPHARKHSQVRGRIGVIPITDGQVIEQSMLAAGEIFPRPSELDQFVLNAQGTDT